MAKNKKKEKTLGERGDEELKEGVLLKAIYSFNDALEILDGVKLIGLYYANKKDKPVKGYSGTFVFKKNGYYIFMTRDFLKEQLERYKDL